MRGVVLGLLSVGLAMPAMAAKGPAFGRAGTWTASGEFSFAMSSGEAEQKRGTTSETSDKPDTTKFEVAPGVGYFLSDGLWLGAELAMQYEKEDQDGDSETTMLNGLLVRPTYYHRLSPGGRLFLYGALGAAYLVGSTERKTAGQSIEGDVSALVLTGGAGVAYALGGSHGGFFTFGYEYSKTETTIDFKDLDTEYIDSANTGGLRTSLGLFF